MVRGWEDDMRIAVFGGTGGTGAQVVAQARAAGHEVAALVRDPARLVSHSDRLQVVVGHIDQQDRVEEVVRGVDAVISALGTDRRGPTRVCTDGIGSILAAMAESRIRRLVAVSAHGAGETHDRSLFSLAVWASVADKMRDKEAMEDLIRASGVDWTIIRPPALTDGPRTGTYRTGTDLKIRLTSRISRADLADFLLREAATPAFGHQAPRIAA